MTTLGYWGIRALAQPIRFLLAYLDVEYTDKQYSDRAEWFEKDKLALNTEFPNIPYLIDGETVVTESSAIPFYIIKKHNRHDLLGQNADGSFSEKEVLVQQLFGVLKDIQKHLYPLVYNPDFNKIKENIYSDSIGPLFQKIVSFLGEKEFLAGTLTYADFLFYEFATILKIIFPHSCTPIVSTFLIRFENLKGIHEYLENPSQDLQIFFPPGRAVWSGPQ